MARRFHIPFLTEPPTSLGQRSMTTQKKSGGFLEVVKTVVVAVLIAIGIRTFAYEPFNIPSG